MNKNVFTGLVAVALAASLAGCGGSKEAASPKASGTTQPDTTSAPSTSSTATPTTTTAAPKAATKAVYLAKANGYCKTMNQQLATVPDPGNDPEQAAASSDRVIAITGPTLQQLRALTPPPGDAQALAAIYQKVDALIGDYAAFSAALRAGDMQTAQTAGTNIDTDARAANAASNAYGLTVCGAA